MKTFFLILTLIITPAFSYSGSLLEQRVGNLEKLLDQLEAKLNLIPQICQVRLSLDSVQPATDVASSTNLYIQPYQGDRCALYSGSDWLLFEISTITIDLTTAKSGGPITSGKNYDIFLYSNSGTPTPVLVEWTGDSNRATTLALQDGVYVLNGTPARRYLGTIRASASGTSTDSETSRFVWNYYNAIRRSLVIADGGTTWTPTNASSFHIANDGLGGVSLAFVLGMSDSLVRARVLTSVGNVSTTVGIDVASNLVNAAQIGGTSGSANTGSLYFPIESEYKGYLPAGYNVIRWIEYGTGTIYGTATNIGTPGLIAELEN